MMTNLFDGEKVSLQEMMDAREERYARQLSLLKKDPSCSLLSVTMNIPGPVKTSVGLEQVFMEMLESIRDLLPKENILSEIILTAKTGCEYYALVNLSAQNLKEMMITLESATPKGRLFDLDVLRWETDHVSILSRSDLGIPARQCYVCSKEAKACGRERRHTIADMQAAIKGIIELA